MTTYESTSLHIEDDNENSLAFSTISKDGETSVLRAWSTQKLPDGQPIEVEVLFTSNDVRDLQSFLVDTLGRLPKTNGGGVAERMSAPLAAYDPSLPIVPGTAYAAGPDGIPAAAFGTLQHRADEAAGEEQFGRQCPVIYDGIQCSAVEDHTSNHQFVVDWTTKQSPQNDARTATPPADAQGASNTPQSVSPDQSAAVSAIGVPAPEAAPASQHPEQGPPKRKRRTKVEIAYDTAKNEYDRATVGGTQEQATAAANELAEAHKALYQKDPGNIRLSETAPAPQNPVAVQTGPSFAPEQPQYAYPTAEQAAAQGFPCPMTSSDGRPCQRPYGHEILTDLNPEPKAHIYATDPGTLGQSPGGYIPGNASIPAAEVAGVFPQSFQPGGPVFGSEFANNGVPAGPLSFQVPPTPEAAPVAVPGADLQPPAPAMPSWQQPQ